MSHLHHPINTEDILKVALFCDLMTHYCLLDSCIPIPISIFLQFLYLRVFIACKQTIVTCLKT